MSENNIKVLSSMIAILAGLLFGFIIMLFTNPGDSLPAFFTILTGGFRDLEKVLYFAAPIIFTGLAVGFAFRTGLFNIGASGQLLVGAYVAIYIGINWDFLGQLQWVVALLASGVAGAIWALIPGLLKAYRNVHEVVATIMMNYIALYLVTYLLKFPNMYNQGRNESLPVLDNAVIPSIGPISGQIILAIIAVVVMYIILEKTTFGFQLKAVGFSRDASKYAGINEKRGIVLSMVISGLLAGFAGSIIYLTDIGKHLELVEVLPAEGFNGIPVALIGLSSPIGILFAGIFLGFIRVSGFYMQLYEFVPEIIDIIISSIIYFSALVIIFKEVIVRVNKRNQQIALEKGDNNG